MANVLLQAAAAFVAAAQAGAGGGGSSLIAAPCHDSDAAYHSLAQFQQFKFVPGSDGERAQDAAANAGRVTLAANSSLCLTRVGSPVGGLGGAAAAEATLAPCTPGGAAGGGQLWKHGPADPESGEAVGLMPASGGGSVGPRNKLLPNAPLWVGGGVSH